MIKKIFLQSIVSAMLFLIVLFSFSRVDWLSVFDLRETVIEEKLGDMYWDLYSGPAGRRITSSINFRSTLYKAVELSLS